MCLGCAKDGHIYLGMMDETNYINVFYYSH